MGPTPLLLLVTLSNTTSECEKAWQLELVHSKHPRCRKDTINANSTTLGAKVKQPRVTPGSTGAVDWFPPVT